MAEILRFPNEPYTRAELDRLRRIKESQRIIAFGTKLVREAEEKLGLIRERWTSEHLANLRRDRLQKALFTQTPEPPGIETA